MQHAGFSPGEAVASEVLQMGKLPILFKITKIVIILKPRKEGKDTNC